MKKKYYAINYGDKKTEIVSDWSECSAKVKGRSGVEYKSFSNKKDAELWLHPSLLPLSSASDTVDVYVDGSFSVKCAYAGWGVVFLKDGNIVEEQFGLTEHKALSRNIDGELWGAAYSIEWSFQKKQKIKLHYDYLGIEEWALGRWKAKSDIAKHYIKAIDGKIGYVEFVKVKAHSGVFANEKADELAKLAITNYLTKNE